MKPRQKEIYILVNAAKCSGRGILQGFLSSVEDRPDFRLHICEMSEYGRKSLSEAVHSRLVDGLVTSELEDPQLAELFENSDIPIVVIGTRERCLPNKTERLRIVTTDERKVASTATRHLINCGRFASYGYIHFREDFCRYLSKQREKGFYEELKRAGLDGVSYATDLPEEKSDAAPMGEWIKSLPKPAALLVGYDRRAAEVLNVCAGNGIAVPEDVRVLGIDNDEIICQHTKPRLSSVTTDNICEGRVAAQQLIDMLRKKKTVPSRKTVICPSRLTVVERESTRVLPPGLLMVQRARKYIADNADNPITVEDVIAHLGVSRRLAYLRFKEFERMSIHRAILLARVSSVKKKLLSSELTIAAISHECGFNNANNLKIIFRRLTGMTMSEWRTIHLEK